MFNPTPIVDRMYNIDTTPGFSIAVTDPDGDTTTTTAIDPPSFMTWTTPSFINGSAPIAGDYTIAMRVCDVWNLCTTESFKLTINQKPVLTTAIPDVTCI